MKQNTGETDNKGDRLTLGPAAKRLRAQSATTSLKVTAKDAWVNQKRSWAASQFSAWLLPTDTAVATVSKDLGRIWELHKWQHHSIVQAAPKKMTSPHRRTRARCTAQQDSSPRGFEARHSVQHAKNCDLALTVRKAHTIVWAVPRGHLENLIGAHIKKHAHATDTGKRTRILMATKEKVDRVWSMRAARRVACNDYSTPFTWNQIHTYRGTTHLRRKRVRQQITPRCREPKMPNVKMFTYHVSENPFHTLLRH